MKGVRGLLTIAACLLLATPAVAGTLYRCDGADGARSYVSKRVAGAKCVVVARSSPAPKRRSTPASVNANAPATFGSESSSKKEVVAFRSEEHTSELQSLMRISYAVFCLKTKNNTHSNTQY